tara:strand:+ start:442 stop:576 length:135 start_codon:yes stop_codon:yes gene_type:complete
MPTKKRYVQIIPEKNNLMKSAMCEVTVFLLLFDCLVPKNEDRGR